MYGTVKITDMERDPRSSSFTTFPDSISYNGNTYTVIGNPVTLVDGSYTDDQGIIYTLSSTTAGNTATITGLPSVTSSVVIIPARVTVDSTIYTVIGTDPDAKSMYQSANITDLTVLVSYPGYCIGNDFMENNGTLKSLKFIVDNDDPSQERKLTIYTEAFEKCTNLETLSLPNIIGVSKIPSETYVSPFRGCTNLKSSSSDEPFLINTKVVFNSTVTDSYPSLFSGCTGIEYLELGKNVNDVSVFGPSKWKDTAWEYTGCPNLKIVYNTSTEISESTIARAIAEGGSKKVLLFNNPGGEFTQTATLSGEDITMPTGTLGGIDIPVWSHKDGITMYNSGNGYKDFSPWGTDNWQYSYYYYALYGSCTVTYHVTYYDTDNTTMLTDTRTQTVVCMYNTPLYDKEDYSATTAIYDKMSAAADLKWTNTFIPDISISYQFGQSVTTHCDLVLYLYLDGITSKTEITITYNWDYISVPDLGTPIVKTFTCVQKVASGKFQLVSMDYFKENAQTSTGSKLSDDATASSHYYPSTGQGSPFGRWSATDGNSAYAGGSVSLYDNITMTAKNSGWKYVYYNDGESKTGDIWYIERGSTITVAPNIFYTRDGYYFDCWSDDAEGTNQYYPGQIITTGDIRFYAVWKELEIKDNKKVIPVEYNYNYGESTKSVTKYPEYDSSECLADDVFTPPTGWKLIGWSYSSDGNVNFSLDTPVTMLNHLKLYAVWEKVSVPLWVIVDNKLLSADELPRDPTYTVIGTLSSGDEVVLTVTYGTDPDPPTAVGVYPMTVQCKVMNGATDVSENYDINVISESFLTIYRGDHASVTD